MDRKQLIAALEAIASSSNMTDDGQLRALLNLGFGEPEAHRIVAFFPVALNRPILEKLGVTQFVDTASIPLEDGGRLEFRLSDQPEHVAALAAARDHFANRTLPHDAFMAVASGSGDGDAASKALNQGLDIAGATVASAFIDRRLARYVVR